MKISKTSVNFAERRKFKIVFNADNSQVRIVRRTHRKTWTVKLENHMRGLFLQKTNLPFMIKEELPYWVENEKHLREMIEFLSKEIGNLKAV